MSADLLRRAAARVREVAEAAVPGPWVIWRGMVCVETGQHDCAGGTPDSNGAHEAGCGIEPIATGFDEVEGGGTPDAEHVALWHPEVALAVADLLDAEARFFEIAENWIGGPYEPRDSDFYEASRARSVGLARLILGEPS